MKLYDRIARDGFRPWDVETPEQREAMMRAIAPIEEAVVLSVDNVSEYVSKHKAHGEWDFERDMFMSVPPFPVTFVESNWTFEMSRNLGTEDRHRTEPPAISQWGALFQTTDMREKFSGSDDPYRDAMLDTRVDDGIWSQHGFYLEERPDSPVVDPVRWRIGFHLFLYDRHHRDSPEGCPLMGVYWLQPSGEIAHRANGTASGHLMFSPQLNEMDQDLVVSLAQILRFSFTFAHCKNVELQEHYPARQERREAERRGAPKPTKFYTLQIEPMKKVLATEGGIAQNGLKKALHICRGHFSTYSEEKPLFGKYAGRFWIPSHVRGTSEVGTVIKDYAVNAPKNREAA